MVGAGTDLRPDEDAFTEAKFFHQECGDEGVGVVRCVVAFWVTEESVAAVVHFQYTIEGAFDNREWRGTEGWSSWGGGSAIAIAIAIASEARARAVWRTATELIGAAATATTAIAATFEASEFAASGAIKAGRSLVSTWFEPSIRVAWGTICRRSVTEAVCRHPIVAEAFATATAATATAATRTVAVKVIAVRTRSGIFVGRSVVRTIVAVIGAEELIAPVGEVVAFAGGVLRGGRSFCGGFGAIFGAIIGSFVGPVF